MKTFVILFTVVILIGIVGCGPDAPKSIPCATVQPTDYGNGVYYFAGSQQFGSELSAFKCAHPELRVTAMTNDGTGVYGSTQGFWVNTEPR